MRCFNSVWAVCFSHESTLTPDNTLYTNTKKRLPGQVQDLKISDLSTKNKFEEV